ncbi:unnamed protein product [Vitrella brassicaformis CCMP3155]|uniref:Uncharacterized protein n=1 Tax=Vitrella brassicaformis (strain CCMP3155) TaxID=1169540 RepID=A0A0G4F8U2_VITBC|nr:unnamed protein product [Vitrella brassicaformis CCMP3155]|eukprot:CEM08616.1 unnamed protein product [Vitrella brassicaformis CCMP3155]
MPPRTRLLLPLAEGSSSQDPSSTDALDLSPTSTASPDGEERGGWADDDSTSAAGAAAAADVAARDQFFGFVRAARMELDAADVCAAQGRGTKRQRESEEHLAGWLD